MINLVTVGAIVAALLVGVVILVRKPTDPRRVVRWSALGITVLVAAALTPYTVDDSGPAASYLLGVPVVAAILPVLAEWSGRLGGVVDVVAAMVIGVWGVLLGLGIGVAFLPTAVLLIIGAVGTRPRPAAPAPVDQ